MWIDRLESGLSVVASKERKRLGERKKHLKPTPTIKGFHMNKVALITGVTGQDGSYLAEFLLEKGLSGIWFSGPDQLPVTTEEDHRLL